MKVALIVNPTAGGGKPWVRVRDYIRKRPKDDYEIEVHVTKAPGHAGEIVRSLSARPPDRIVVCGGDGTVNEVLAQYSGLTVPLGVLPAGTSNVLCREIGVPLEPIRALETVLKGTIRYADFGLLGGETARPFLLMAGVGIDAYIVSIVNQDLKKRIGIGAYYLAALQSLRSYAFPEFQVVTEHQSIHATSCVIANAHNYGGNLLLTPDATIWDGCLDLLVVCGKPKLGYARLILYGLLHLRVDYPWAKRLRVRQVSLEGKGSVPVQVDGEVGGLIPCRVELIHAGVPLIVPS